MTQEKKYIYIYKLRWRPHKRTNLNQCQCQHCLQFATLQFTRLNLLELCTIRRVEYRYIDISIEKNDRYIDAACGIDISNFDISIFFIVSMYRISIYRSKFASIYRYISKFFIKDNLIIFDANLHVKVIIEIRYKIFWYTRII